MKQVLNKIKLFFQKIWAKENVKAFCLIYFIGLICFSFEAVNNHFTLPLSGDYTLQTYAFYSQGYHVFWDFIKTGEYPLYDFSNYLGANYVGTQSFYYLFSPLFYILCLCPEPLLYQGIFFHMVFKFALGGFFMYLLLRKYFHVSFKMSWLGGFIYAFSGWSLFYLWFHFGDAMAFFPLFIMGIERCLKERKGGLLIFATCLCGLSNYFFLANYCLFGAAYALYRWIYIYGVTNRRGFTISQRWGVLLQGILCCLCGILLAGICLLPSLEIVMSTNRTQTSSSYLNTLLSFIFSETTKTGDKWVFKSISEIFSFYNIKDFGKHLFVWESRQIGDMTINPIVNTGYVLSNWIYMNVNCWDNIMFSNASLDNALGGFFITTPLTMLLIPSIVKVFKSKRIWGICGLLVCIILPFLPITSHLAFGFSSLYGRWQLWIVLIGIIFIIPTLDQFEKVDRRLVTINLILNYAIAIAVYFISKKEGKLPNGEMLNIFGKEVSSFIFLTFIECLGMALVYVIYRFKFFKPAMVKKIMTGLVILEIGTSCIVTIEHKGYANWEKYYLAQPQYSELIDVIDELKESDPSFYRVMNTEATRSIMNLPAALNYNGASSFNSTYNFALDTFKNRSKMAYGGTWTMGNHEKRYWLDQYLGTKYYIIDKKDPNNDNADYHQDLTLKYDGRTSMSQPQQKYNLNLAWNYSLYKSYEYYDVYINNNFDGIGYLVDTYMSDANAGTGRFATFYEELYSSVAIVEEETINTLKTNYTHLTYNPTYNSKISEFNSYNWDYYFSPREDTTYHLTGTDERQEYKVDRIDKKTVQSYFKNDVNFMHRRWIERDFYGDQFILRAKNELLAANATEDNPCFINLAFKLGPKVLISLYNGETLITQDAHMNSNSSLGVEKYEWKLQRGFYVNQPVDKIVIEFIDDTPFDKLFNSSGSLTNYFNIQYYYKDKMDLLQNQINENLIEDVTYHNNTFTFKTNSTSKKIAVTNIPYDSGWTLKMNGKVHEIFNVNGGFVGFISDDAEAYYELSYFTPKLKEGLVASGVGLLLFIILAFVYRNKHIQVLACEREIALAYQQIQQANEEQYFKEHEKYVQGIIQKIRNKWTKK